MDTEFFHESGLGVIRLNRPAVLNALGPAQFPVIHDQLRAWAEDASVGAVMIEGAGGRAFCAGGDIKAVWNARQRGDLAANHMLFRQEYTLNRAIHRYGKPYVAILDGLVMGGGAGLSLNGQYQVVTERTVFAMPEAAIGFFPDVGGTHFLSRAPGNLGLYLGLTGARLDAADMLWAGLATHYVPSAELDGLKRDLARAAATADPAASVAQVLAGAHSAPNHASPWPDRMAALQECFAAADISSVVARLEAREEPWLAEAGQLMAAASPTSLAVIFRQLTEGKGMPFEAAIAREYRMARAFLRGEEFFEGIRAALVDKDRTPRWAPATLAEVLAQGVDAFFAPLDDELDFDQEGGCRGRA